MYRIGVKPVGRFTEKLKNLIPTKRRIIQLYAALLTNANIKGFFNGKIYQGNVKNMCAPGLNCYSCPAASAACPLGALQNALANSNARLPYYVFGILILYGVTFGRWICGFLCPFGLIQDLAYKIKTPKIKKSAFTRILSYFKYVLLGVFVFAMPLIYALREMSIPLPAFCKYICPSGTFLGAGGLLANQANDYMFGMLGPLFTWKFVLLMVFIIGMIFMYRFFCRFICPLGAIYGLFNRISLLGMKVDQSKCTDCGLCVNECKMDIKKVSDRECISCGSCISACPTKAISYKGSKIFLPDNEISGNTEKKTDRSKLLRITVACGMALLLVGALVYYNVIDKVPDEEVSTEVSTEYGNDIGDLCYDYEMSLYGGGTFSLSDNKGKITVINFWGTWCTPCVAELVNEFPQIADEYKDVLKVVTVHSYEEYGVDVNEYIKEHFADTGYIFCRDGEGNKYCNMLGGGQAWPHTVIVDEDGIIVSVIPRATSYDELKTVIDGIINN